jgi:steroid delta-isomerase-like uncharacterized protein
MKDITQTLFDAFNRRDFETLDSLSSDHLEWLDVPSGIKFLGKNGLKTWCQAWASAFSDSQVKIENHFISGEFTCTEYVGKGTHTGELKLGTIKVPATHKPVEFRMVNVVRIQDGKIVNGKVYFDLSTLLRQVGMIEKPMAA